MTRTLLIAGGGIAGMAAALATARVGWQVSVYERSAAFSEVGAGIQLGPNATRLLHGWGLEAQLQHIAGEPTALSVRDARNGGELARMALGQAFRDRYGAPYLTAHRADLHSVLKDAAVSQGAVLRPGRSVVVAEQTPDGASLQLDDGALANGEAVLCADGLWSTLRAQLLDEGLPRPVGHLAYRTLIQRADAPSACDANEVTVWLGPRLHVVGYPVRRGDALNLVAIVEGHTDTLAQEWDARGEGTQLNAALGQTCTALRDLIATAPQWRLWALHDRPAVRGPEELARGRIVLLGDAAHPMLPYLAQGAAMAIEDAHVLASELQKAGSASHAIQDALASYASARWQRCARVQRRALRNARIFHASGVLRVSRDLALRAGGPRLLDIPWLFRGS